MNLFWGLPSNPADIANQMLYLHLAIGPAQQGGVIERIDVDRIQMGSDDWAWLCAQRIETLASIIGES